MAVERDALTSTKDRPVPVGPEGTVAVRDNELLDVLKPLLREIMAMRLILAEAFDVDIDPEEMEL